MSEEDATNERALNPLEIVLRDSVSAGLAENTTLLQRDGDRFAVEDSAAPIRDQAGEVIGVVLVLHDVSQARACFVEDAEPQHSALRCRHESQ